MKPWRVIAIIPPGLEDLAILELKALGVEAAFENFGQLGLIAHPDLLFRLHNLARIPSRFLVEIGRFQAKHFKEFRKKLETLPLKNYLTPGQAQFKITCRHCKLYHTGAIEEAARLALEAPEVTGTTVHILGQDDEFLISIDASGEHLHRRGILEHRGEAPLRENLAAGMVRSLPNPELFWDPFCGSGTLPLESLLQGSSIPIGRYRSFGFESWPCTNLERYRTKLAELEELVKPCPWKILGSDCDDRVLEAANHNFTKAKLVDQIELFQADVREINLSSLGSNSRSIISNPPYNERLFQGKCVLKSIKTWAGQRPAWKIALLLPSMQAGIQGEILLRFKNGGKPVSLRLLTK
jgi:putative N6-adenine-specific DNA methylase